MKRYWLKIIFLISLGIFQCLNPFAPKLEDSDQGDLIITPQATPDEVLQNFKYAYVFKDSVLYADLLDSSFVFTYFDLNQEPVGKPESWGRNEDLKTTGRLFRNFDIIDLIWNTTIYSFEDENQVEYSKTFNLALIKNNETINITGNAIFIFKKSEYDNKWRITQWVDESDL